MPPIIDKTKLGDWPPKKKPKPLKPQNQVAVDKALNYARKGIHEQPMGSNSGPQVSKWIRKSGGSPGQPWCQYFANNMFYETSHYWFARSGATGDVYAAKWKKYGVRNKNKIRPGDWVYHGGQHVMIATGYVKNGQVKIVGGNQSDAVTKYSISVSSIYPANGIGTGVIRPPY